MVCVHHFRQVIFMSEHGYNSGRLNLPFVGISTFSKSPYVENWDAIDADVAILGAPFDFGTQWRSGARFGPRGIRNVSSTAKEGYDYARAQGSDILSVRQVRKLGVEGVLERIPAGKRYYLTIDIDGFDPSIAPGTGTPSHGGFLYYDVLEIIAGLAKRGDIVGIDLVEIAPDYDHTGTTAILAAQILLNTIGRIFTARK